MEFWCVLEIVFLLCLVLTLSSVISLLNHIEEPREGLAWHQTLMSSNVVWSFRSFEEWLSQKHLFLSKELIAGFAITRKATFYCQRIRDMKYFVNDFVSCPSWSDLFINLCCLKFHLLRFCWQMVLKLVSKMLTHKCFF